MKVLIDIGHPGHVHLFRNFARIFLERGHAVLFTIREKEYEAELLRHAGLRFTVLGKHYSSSPGKFFGLLRYNLQVLFISLRFKPDIFFSHGSIYTLMSAFLLRKPNISMEDSGNPEQVKLYLPFTSAILTSTSFPVRYGRKQIYYEGYHELAYLHPDYFRPDPAVLAELGLRMGEKYSIVRFVAWKASHDKKHHGLNYDQKVEIIRQLSRFGKVFISSESPLPPDLEMFSFPLGPERLHHAMAFAELYVGEGATMASECAVLGTHAVYINTIRRGYLEEQEKDFSLVSCIGSYEVVNEIIAKLLTNPYLKTETKNRRERLIDSKCDVTAFLVKFIEEWPDSFLKNR